MNYPFSVDQMHLETRGAVDFQGRRLPVRFREVHLEEAAREMAMATLENVLKSKEALDREIDRCRKRFADKDGAAAAEFELHYLTIHTPESFEAEFKDTLPGSDKGITIDFSVFNGVMFSSIIW